jgi:hypothetical protein
MDSLFTYRDEISNITPYYNWNIYRYPYWYPLWMQYNMPVLVPINESDTNIDSSNNINSIKANNKYSRSDYSSFTDPIDVEQKILPLTPIPFELSRK